MGHLVALAMPGGDGFVTALKLVWGRGDAVLVLDHRLPPTIRQGLLEELAPGSIIEAGDSEQSLPGGRPVEDGDALVVATSGTTGDPKGAVLTHQALVAHAHASSARLGVDPGRDRWLACLPLAHVGGLSVVTRALTTGTPLTVLPGFDVKAVAAASVDGATLVSLVPTTLARIDPAIFRAILVGGSAPPDRLPANVVTTYGMTETGGGVVYDGIPFDGVEVALAGDGEILLRTPTLARCYRTAREDLPVARPDGWYATGDIGSLGGARRLTVHGRADEMIVTGGEKVWPAAVEPVLSEHPAVLEVAVTGRPDPDWGQRVVAYVVPTDPGSPPTLDELRGLVKETLPPWAAPREMVLLDRLPRTRSGKVQRAVIG